ncbi:MAG: adenosylcobinamide amidohydrolase [Clostridia bacterium]|nr:adenosylcobinamide amidohydrolase [Clostridia bacterium]
MKKTGGACLLPITLSNGDHARRLGHALVLTFAGPRRVLSTSAYRGGVREDLRCVYNYDMSHGKTRLCELLAPTQAEHMRLTAVSLGLPDESSGLCTGAQIANLSVAAEVWDGVTVTAMVTAGIDENGGRAGDPASWQEKDGTLGLPVGTINLLLHFDCDLPDGVLAVALITATEAKCAAVQELLLPSVVSTGLATGSGTDGAILICDPGAAHRLTDAGKHSKLGEQIGRAVLRAVKEALLLQSGAGPERLQNPDRHLARWRLPEGTQRAFLGRPVQAALCAHLLDLESWGVFSPAQIKPAWDKLEEDIP